MTVAIARDPIYRGRRFQSEIIELCVRWYLTYRLSYRDLVEMLAERGVVVSHTTIYRWVQQYVPEFDRRWSRYAKAVHPSCRVDETAISVRGGHRYLYRAVDKFGKTVESYRLDGRTAVPPSLKVRRRLTCCKSPESSNLFPAFGGEAWLQPLKTVMYCSPSTSNVLGPPTILD